MGLFLRIVFAPEVKQLRQAPPSDATAVVYQHRSVTSISKQPIYTVLTLICHARRLQLSSEACAIQQEVRRKSTQELLRSDS